MLGCFIVLYLVGTDAATLNNFTEDCDWARCLLFVINGTFEQQIAGMSL